MADSSTFVHLPPSGSPVSPSYRYRITRASAGGGDIIEIPSGLRRGVSVVLIVTSGSGKVQYSVTPDYYYRDVPGNITWVDWSNGVVTTTTGNQFGPITALRINNTSGSQTLEIYGD